MGKPKPWDKSRLFKMISAEDVTIQAADASTPNASRDTAGWEALEGAPLSSRDIMF